MNFLEEMVLNSIYILFPLFLYLFYLTYVKVFSKKENEIILDFCLLTSFYLIVRFGMFNISISFLILNIPLLISYVYRRNLSIITISIAIIFYSFKLNSNIIIFVIIENIIYYLLSLKLVNDKKIFIYVFIIEKTISMLLLTYFNQLMFSDINELIIAFISFYLIIFITMLSLEKGEKVIKLEITLKELQKEKQIRTSLFKITHEIKNPIAVCKGYLDMFDTNNIDHSRKYIPIIRSEINRTLILLQDFLDCNHLKINKDLLDINLLLEDVTDECEPLIENKKINYISNVSEDELYIQGDYERLKQVLVNVIKNSIEAIVPKDNSYIEIDTEIDKNNIHIFIEDNGVGISKDDLDKIKDPFYTTKKDGTGLGVTLSMEIIKGHNGKMIYTSNEGQGTKVEIILPLNNEVIY